MLNVISYQALTFDINIVFFLFQRSIFNHVFIMYANIYKLSFNEESRSNDSFPN